MQFDVAELAADRRGRGGVKLLDQSTHPLDVGVGGQHDDLLARGIRNELGLELGIARLLAQLTHHLSSQGDEFGGGLAVDWDDRHLAFLAFRGEVHHGQDGFDLFFLFLGGRHQQSVVGIVGDHRRLRLVFKTPVGHALVDEAVEAGEGGFQSCMAQRQDVQRALKRLGLLSAEVADDFLDAGQVIFGGGDNQAAGVGLGHDLGMGSSACVVAGDLAAVDLLDQRDDTLGIGDATEVNEAGLLRLRIGGAGLQLRDDVGGGLHVAGGSRDHDALAAGFHRDAGGRNLLAVGQGLGEGFGQDLADVLHFRGAGAEDTGDLNDLRLGGRAGHGGASGAVDGLVQSVDQGFDLVGHAGQGSSDDQSVGVLLGDDPGLGGGRRSRFVGGGDTRDGLTDHVGQLLGLDDLGGVNADIAGSGSTVFETGDEFVGQRQSLTGSEEDQRAGSVIVHGRHVVVGIGR